DRAAHNLHAKWKRMPTGVSCQIVRERECSLRERRDRRAPPGLSIRRVLRSHMRRYTLFPKLPGQPPWNQTPKRRRRGAGAQACIGTAAILKASPAANNPMATSRNKLLAGPCAEIAEVMPAKSVVLVMP